MKTYKCFLFFFAAVLLLTSCKVSYLLKSSLGQIDILNKRVSLEKLIEDSDFDPQKKRKLKLALDAKVFAQEQMGLKPTQNYSTYTELDRPYATWVVSASEKWALKAYTWSFPIVGEVPYKGFFTKEEAEEEFRSLQDKNLDVFLRGVSAYSTLGWFEDPILSSMMGYEDEDLVNLIIHESTHATIYLKNQADYNEQLATFVGNKGAELYFLKKEGEASPLVKKIQKRNQDEALFSKFITEEINRIENWYTGEGKQLQTQDLDQAEASRRQRIQNIQEKFEAEIKPQLKTNSYEKFPTLQLNNARLLLYKTYQRDLSRFEKLYKDSGENWKVFFEKVMDIIP